MLLIIYGFAACILALIINGLVKWNILSDDTITLDSVYTVLEDEVTNA